MISPIRFGQQAPKIQTTPRQQEKYWRILQNNVDWALDTFDAARSGSLDSLAYNSFPLTPRTLAALHILNRAFPGFNTPMGGGYL